MREIKVGDRVKLEGWVDFYEVCQNSEDRVYLTDMGWYTKDIPWIFKDEQVMNKIDLNKKYRDIETKLPVRILCVDRNDPKYSVVYLSVNLITGRENTYHCSAQGLLWEGTQVIEEIPQVDWSKVAVDTPVWVKYFEGGSIFKRHFFCHTDCGEVEVFDDGKTSHTAKPGECQSVYEAYLDCPNA